MLRGYKVVNYNRWSSLPEIFNTVNDAIKGSKGWKYRDGAVIESFILGKPLAKVVKYLKSEA